MRGLAYIVILLLGSAGFIYFKSHKNTSHHFSLKTPKTEFKYLKNGNQPDSPSTQSRSPEVNEAQSAEREDLETQEEKIERLAKIVASEDFFKKALEIEKQTMLPELKEESLIEDENYGDASYKKYKVGDQEILVGGNDTHYSEAIYNNQGDPILVRNYLDGQMKSLQIKMPTVQKGDRQVLGTHSFSFDQKGVVMNIYSDVDGVQVMQRFNQGKLIERGYVKENKDGDAQLVTF